MNLKTDHLIEWLVVLAFLSGAMTFALLWTVFQ